MNSRKELSAQPPAAEQGFSSLWYRREQAMPSQHQTANIVNTQEFKPIEKEQPGPSGDSTQPVHPARARINLRRLRQRYNRSLKSGRQGQEDSKIDGSN